MLPPDLSKAEFHLLYVFATVVEAGGFSAAQIELNVSPSTISRQISDLEIRLGVTLCQRGRAGFRLTEKGEVVYRAAQRLFASVRDFSEAVDGSRDTLAGHLALAVIDNWVFNRTSPFARALDRFVEIAPDVTLELFSLAPDDIELAVQDGRVALGFGVFHRDKPGLVYHPIGQEQVSLYCATSHPLAELRDVEEITQALPKAHYARRAYLRESDVAPISKHLTGNATAHQIEGIAQLILTGKYVGYLPEHFAALWEARGEMCRVGAGDFDQPTDLKIVRKRGSGLGYVAQRFEALVLEQAADQGPCPSCP